MQKERRLAALAQRLALFRGLTITDVAQVFHKGSAIRLDTDETVVYKGAKGDILYVIIQGGVGVYDGDRLLATLPVGEIFGEMALCCHTPRSATVVALEPTVVFALSEKAFQTLLTKRVAVRILMNIVKTLSARLRDANRQLMDDDPGPGFPRVSGMPGQPNGHAEDWPVPTRRPTRR